MERKGAGVQEPDLNLSLADQAYRRIEEMIVERVLPPGSMLSEKQLCEELDFGRTPIREAMQRLRIEGYIVIMPSRGALVAPIDVLAQLDLLEMRRPLEDLLVRLGADRATLSQRNELKMLADALCSAAQAGDRPAFFRTNRGLQQVQCEAGHNGLLARTMLVVYGQSRRFWYTALDDTSLMERAAEQHRVTALAIAERDADAAAASVETFLQFLEELTRTTLDRRRPA
ncbi:MAG: transcriptional regulator, GntR family [Sphingomonadales bacterium]|nr:transcriptional regulator, GntR family [Sphingomonadales bacterium]